MRVKPLQIHWHDKQPIYSAHFEPGPKGRLATAGGDGSVRIWRIVKDKEKDSTHVEFLSSLNRHTAAVNVVRFSPTAECLASAGDDGNIILWRPSETKDSSSKFAESDDEEERETWRAQSMMRGSLSDIYDLAWSPDGRYIISGSIDNTARIWDVKDAKCIHVIADHHHYVQGVAWDPLGEFVATQSSDRSVHVYAFKVEKGGHVSVVSLGKSTKLDLTKLRSIPQPPTSTANSSAATNTKASAETASDAPAEKGETTKPTKAAAKTFRLYHDETLTSFFRRLSFTPDGSMLLTPAGQYKAPVHKQKEDDSGSAPQAPDLETRNTVYIYARRDFSKGPVAHLPGHKKPSVAIKCSPVLYELRQQLKPPSSNSEYSQRAMNRMDSKNGTSSATMGEKKDAPSVFGLGYRSVYAVATQDSVLIYDTQQTTALALISHLHYATFTDMAWSGDGCNLILTSSDGFCSIISFEEGELGAIYTPPKSMMALLSTGDGAATGGGSIESTDSSATLAATAGMLQKLNGLSLAEQKDPKETKEPKESQKAKAKQEKSTLSEGKKTVKQMLSKSRSTAAAAAAATTSTASARKSTKKERDGDSIMASAQDEPLQKRRKTQLPQTNTAATVSAAATTATATASTSTLSFAPASTSSASASTPTTLSNNDASNGGSNVSEEKSKKKRITPIFVSALPAR
ncbi:MAG: WD40-repeat-containing domain protein [Benniella sp.]|nr:MAG: WD40-repeat-containing domain protein [Benniella sp.]